ncbi:MAG: BlaI/MecI/CopY family transcriptional regulator [Verrucomicrobiales bacterium]|nr:BlaI/MecI/CopY family transcriptional regulator [Verrucomicrobiales bacterium]
MKSPQIPKISDAEWCVMRVIWELEEATSSEIVDALSGDTEWKPRTIRTLIGRLVKKGALEYTEQGREYLYRAKVDERSCEREASQTFLDRVFQGRLTPFLSHFSDDQTYTDEEIAELKRIVETHEERKAGKKK